jgi:transcription antitermination factor NusB
MRKRTRAREIALQALYQLDITHGDSGSALEKLWQMLPEDELIEEQKEFSTKLVNGVLDNIGQLDDKISQYAANWKLERMAVVDRNILRMSAFELLFCQDIPPKVSINESVYLAKKFSGKEAGKFVNAILDKIKQEKEK